MKSSSKPAVALRARRRTDTEFRDRERLISRAKQAALHDLARFYPAKYNELLDLHMKLLEVPPAAMTKLCECGATITRYHERAQFAKKCDACDPRAAGKRASGRKRIVYDKKHGRTK